MSPSLTSIKKCLWSLENELKMRLREFDNIFKNLEEERRIVQEIEKIFEHLESEEEKDRELFQRQTYELEKKLLEKNSEILQIISRVHVVQKIEEIPLVVEKRKRKVELEELEIKTIKRIKKKEKSKEKKKDPKPSSFVSLSNKFFSGASKKLSEGESFEKLGRELSKGNFPYLLRTYISIILFSTFLSFAIGVLTALFFLFFNVSSYVPFITQSSEPILGRLIKVVWIPIVLPIATFIIAYLYPSLEKSSIESRINRELPFAAIHMSAISGSSIEPSKIFRIIISTKEYPAVEKELYKIINEMSVFGKDLVTSLKSTAEKCPSRKLADLFNGIATTITSGGDLSNFFDKRANSLLFDYRLDREKETKYAETFMDIYISVVIAAPMILMLLLIMMKVSGIGIGFSTGMITLIMVSSVIAINIGSLALLRMRQNK